jgi:hypothetical protein
MSKRTKEKQTVTRRDFLKITGAISALIMAGVKSVAQAAQKTSEKFLERIRAAYAQDGAMSLRKSQDNPQMQSLYADFLGQPLGGQSEVLLHTSYVDRSAAVTAVRPKPVRTLPGSPAIVSVYPNPFNATTEIEFRTSEPGMVWLAVFNAAGQRVRSLVERSTPAGAHRIRWDGRDGYGRTVSSGLYIARLVSGSGTASQRMTLLK